MATTHVEVTTKIMGTLLFTCSIMQLHVDKFFTFINYRGQNIMFINTNTTIIITS